MTIDEAIQHAEKVAKRYEYLVESDNEGHGFYGTNENCVKCAKEHRQLAEWLRELKWWRSQKHNCDTCKYYNTSAINEPCFHCDSSTDDKWECGYEGGETE